MRLKFFTISRLSNNLTSKTPPYSSSMERRVRTNPAASDSEEPSETTAPNSPSCDDIKVKAPSTKKRKTVQKKVVSVPISEMERSKSKGDTSPPSDSWTWRKYGQKLIKGSPYPRGYYRCSSAKGCPAKKQVERSRVDPTMFIITYTCDHTHPSPINKSSASTSPPSTSTNSISGAAVSATESFRDPPKFELSSSESRGVLLDDGFGWFNEVASISALESPICSVEEDVAWTTMEEDDGLFADLGELPECLAVFRRSRLSLSSSVIACGGRTQ